MAWMLQSGARGPCALTFYNQCAARSLCIPRTRGRTEHHSHLDHGIATCYLPNTLPDTVGFAADVIGAGMDMAGVCAHR
jgi:hypothetical protein